MYLLGHYVVRVLTKDTIETNVQLEDAQNMSGVDGDERVCDLLRNYDRCKERLTYRLVLTII